MVIQSNSVNGNTASCESEDAGFVSGVGVALLGADHVIVNANDIESNVPTGPTFLQGGVVVESGPSFTPAQFNTVTGNTILHNSPDLFWDSLGIGNVLRPNTCKTSIPSSLCGSAPTS